MYGGEDLNGPVYIQDCNRMNPDYYLADYTSLDDLKERTTPKPNDYAKISIPYKWSDLVSQTLKDGERLPIVNTFNAGELKVTSWGTGVIPTVETLKDLPANGSLGQTVFVIDQNSYWSWVPEANSWYDTYLEDEPTDANEKVVFEQRYDYALIKENVFDWVDKGQFYHWYEPMSPFADNYILDFRYFLDRNLMTEEQVEDIKYNYVLPISRLNRKRWPLYKEYQNLNQQLLTWNATYDECKIARDAIDKSIRTNYAIYEKNADGDIVLKETNVSAYPPGANINTTGWVEAAIVYSESDAPEVATYADMPKSPKIGDYVRVKDEAKVYVQTATYQFEDTICAYLGWNEGDIKNTAAAADMRKKEWLFSNDGKIEARVRNEGLFQKFRDEELFGDKGDREKLAPWYNPPANIKEVPKGPTGDPDETSTMHPYYDAQSRFVTEQINMNDALDRITTIEEQLTYLLKKIELLENSITALEHGLREKYGDYLVEGVFTDDTMVWIYNLWYAGLEALELYHRPLVTYELGVVDVSGLPEYRTVTTDIYHDIVYRLNQANLVLPNPGDYCYVTDNKLGIVREKANITSTIRNLSNPSQHQITIATVDTNTEDLIGKVVTAANTIYSKEQIYNRSAIVNADGTIAQDSITSSLDDNSGKITVMSNNGTVLLGDNGIITTDRDNALLRMQYTGKGIFSSTNGGVTWENIVNAGKISIKSLSAGSIDSNSISISNIGHDASIIIDGKGISAVNYSGATSSPTLDALKVDDHTSFFLDAQTGNAYFRGHLVAASGDIAGWQIGKTALTKGNTGMSSSGDYAFWAGNATAANAPFWVKHDGSVKASNADITGKIVVTNSNSTVNTGTVGGWKADSDGLSNGGKLVLSPSGGAITGVINNSGSRSDWAIFMNGNFGVLTNGTMYAANANIKGHIEATSGTFSGTIEAATIKGSTVSGTTITGGSINCQDVNIKGAVNATSGTFKGTVYASAGSFKGKVEATSGSFKGSVDATDGTFRGNLYTSSGTLGPWTISGSGLLDGSGNGLRVGNYADGSATRYRTIVDSSKGIALHVRSTSNTDNICLKPGNITHGLFVGRCSGINAIYVNSHNAVILQNNGRASSYNSTNGLYYDRDNNGVDIGSPHNMVQVGAQISSRDMKYDITRLNNEELSDLWKLYQELNTYKFKYKYGRLKGESDFGFIIDEFLEKSNSNMWVQKMSLEEDPRYVDHVTGTLCVNRSDLTDPDRSSMVHNYQYDREEINKMNMIVCSMLVNKIEQLEKEIEMLKKES